MTGSRVDEFRQRRRSLARRPVQGPEHIGSILPRVLDGFAQRVMLDGGVTRETFLADPVKSLDALLEKAKKRDGEFNAKTVVDVLFSWIKDDASKRRQIQDWMGNLPSKVSRNQRQAPFLQGLKDLLASFGEEQSDLFPH